MLCMSFLWIFSFIAIKVRRKKSSWQRLIRKLITSRFQFLSSLIAIAGMHGTMFLFAVNSLVGALFVITFLPETKEKSFDEIVDLL